MFQGKEEFFAAVPPLVSEDVAVPGLAKPVRLRALSVADMIRYEEAGENQSNLKSVTTLIVMSAVDGAGEPLFDESDGARLQSMLTPPAYQALADAAAKLNGLTKEEVEETAKK